MMLRAEVTAEQMKALRLWALQNDTTMQKVIGDLISAHLDSVRTAAA